jgi:hypothetical protein
LSTPSEQRSRLRLRPEALDWVDVEQEVVVLDSDRSVYLATNSSGAILWRKLIEGATREELADELVKTFNISDELANQDVDSYVNRLLELGLLADDDG